MPITVEWDDEVHTVILINFNAPWTWPEYESARAHSYLLASNVSHIVDVIADFHHSDFAPHNVLVHARHALDTAPLNLRRFIMAGANPFLWQAHGALSQAYPMLVSRFAIAFVETLGEARIHLAELRAGDGG